jgi:hypothetical protein
MRLIIEADNIRDFGVALRGDYLPFDSTVSWLRIESLRLSFQVICHSESAQEVVCEGGSEGRSLILKSSGKRSVRRIGGDRCIAQLTRHRSGLAEAIYDELKFSEAAQFCRYKVESHIPLVQIQISN